MFFRGLAKNLFIPCQGNNFRPRILETQYFFVLVGFLVGVKVLSVLSFYGYLGADIFNQVSQEDLYKLTNRARQNNLVPELKINPKLETVAQLKLADMFQNNYFSHSSPSGITPWNWFDRANYNYKIAGENLAMSFISSNEIVKAWLNSESHRKNLLLKDFDETGIAIGSGIIDGEKTTVVVQVFGRQPPVITSVSKIIPKVRIAKAKAATVSKPQLVITPKPTTLMTAEVKTSPVSLKTATLPKVKSAESEKSSSYSYAAYFSNYTLNKIIIAFAVAAVLILLLKIFIAFHIQFPTLIFKAALLIVISLVFVWLKDNSLLNSKIKISDRADIKVSLQIQ